MTNAGLAGMDVVSLMDLRKQVEETLHQRRAVIQRQLQRMDGEITTPEREPNGRRLRRASSLKGRKVAPKYRGASGRTWAGRGARPRWLVAALKKGKKLDDFLIANPTRKEQKKRKSKGKSSYSRMV